MIKLVTDGAVDMPDSWKSIYDIHVLPLRIRFGERTYVQGIDIGPDNFYQLVEQKKEIPKTSLPSPFQIAEFYRGIAQKGEKVLSIHIASKMSGTFAAVQMAAKEVAGEFDVTPFDSGAGSAAMAFMCREARLLDQAGATLQEIIKRLEDIRRRLIVVFTVDSLEFAHMSGRVNALQSALSSMLKIKPIIVLRDGVLEMADKVRTRHRSLETILEKVKERVGTRKVIVAVVHAADPDTAHFLAEKAKTMFNITELIVTDLAIPVAANLGPRTVGIAAYTVE